MDGNGRVVRGLDWYECRWRNATAKDRNVGIADPYAQVSFSDDRLHTFDHRQTDVHSAKDNSSLAWDRDVDVTLALAKVMQSRSFCYLQASDQLQSHGSGRSLESGGFW